MENEVYLNITRDVRATLETPDPIIKKDEDIKSISTFFRKDFNKENYKEYDEIPDGIYALLILYFNMDDGIKDLFPAGSAIREMTVKKVISLLINLYITIDDPVIITEQQILKLPIFDLLTKDRNNDEAFMKALKDNQINTDTKDLLILFKAASEIYGSDEGRMNFLDKYITGYYNRKVHECASEIGCRYGKYFEDPDDGKAMAMYLFQILSGYQSLGDTQNGRNLDCNNFLDFYSDQRANVDVKIIRDIVGDCVTKMMSSGKPLDRHKYMANYIVDHWDDNKAEETPFVLPSDPYTDNPELQHERVTLEAMHKSSAVMHQGEKKIYNAYRKYKETEEKVDSQLTKAVAQMKKVAVGDVRTEIIEGKKFTVLGLLKRILVTYGLFAISPVKACIALLIRYALKKRTTDAERRKIIMELDTEIEMITEKIEDAKGDNNREAKYNMMRTKKELENAKSRIQYGLDADERSLRDAKNTLNSAQSF